KLAARELDAIPQLGRDFLPAMAHAQLSIEQRLPEVSPDDLKAAWAAILQRAQLNAPHQISRETLSVRDHMTRILRRLRHLQFLEFQELFDEPLQEGASPAVVVVHFIAMLELAREGLLEITQ